MILGGIKIKAYFIIIIIIVLLLLLLLLLNFRCPKARRKMSVNVISPVANCLTQQDRMEGINLQLGDWHAASQKVLSVSTTNINS